MVPKIACFIFFLFFSFKGFSQEQTSQVNLILLIDEKIVESGIYDGFFIIKDGLGDLADSIAFRHQVGKLILAPADHKRLLDLKPEAKVLIDFKYNQFCPNTIKYKYSKELSIYTLTQRYIIFKIYNFNKESNNKKFKERQGYGIEIISPASSLILPRRKHKKADVYCN